MNWMFLDYIYSNFEKVFGKNEHSNNKLIEVFYYSIVVAGFMLIVYGGKPSSFETLGAYQQLIDGYGTLVRLNPFLANVVVAKLFTTVLIMLALAYSIFLLLSKKPLFPTLYKILLTVKLLTDLIFLYLFFRVYPEMTPNILINIGPLILILVLYVLIARKYKLVERN